MLFYQNFFTSLSIPSFTSLRCGEREFLFFINLAYLNNGKIPINPKSEMGYIAPLPHVLMLTAIVVGVAFTAVALSLLIKINRGYRTSRESVIIKKENPKI